MLATQKNNITPTTSATATDTTINYSSLS